MAMLRDLLRTARLSLRTVSGPSRYAPAAYLQKLQVKIAKQPKLAAQPVKRTCVLTKSTRFGAWHVIDL
jgi:hypothetical protein